MKWPWSKKAKPQSITYYPTKWEEYNLARLNGQQHDVYVVWTAIFVRVDLLQDEWCNLTAFEYNGERFSLDGFTPYTRVPLKPIGGSSTVLSLGHEVRKATS